LYSFHKDIDIFVKNKAPDKKNVLKLALSPLRCKEKQKNHFSKKKITFV